MFLGRFSFARRMEAHRTAQRRTRLGMTSGMSCSRGEACDTLSSAFVRHEGLVKFRRLCRRTGAQWTRRGGAPRCRRSSRWTAWRWRLTSTGRSTAPKTYRELEREGRLDQSLHEASAKTGQAFGELVEGGLEPHAAWEAVREEWAFLPAEADTAEEPWWSEEGVSENDA